MPPLLYRLRVFALIEFGKRGDTKTRGRGGGLGDSTIYDCGYIIRMITSFGFA
jgi:hypothetical protein